MSKKLQKFWTWPFFHYQLRQRRRFHTAWYRCQNLQWYHLMWILLQQKILFSDHWLLICSKSWFLDKSSWAVLFYHLKSHCWFKWRIQSQYLLTHEMISFLYGAQIDGQPHLNQWSYEAHALLCNDIARSPLSKLWYVLSVVAFCSKIFKTFLCL